MTKQKNCGIQIAECGLKNIELNDNIEELYSESKSKICNPKSLPDKIWQAGEIRSGFTPLEIKEKCCDSSRSFISKKSEGLNITSNLRSDISSELSLTGFTLLELLIALSISSIIFLVIISTYSLTMNTLGKWDNREENHYLARNIFRRMNDEVSSLYSKDETSAVEGDEKTFSFYTTAKSLYFPFSCLIRVTYKFVTNDEGENFLIREEKPRVNFSLEEKMYLKSYVWSEDLKDLSFKYSDGKKWYDSWNPEKKNQIPRAVKIVLVSSREQTFSTIIYIPTI